MMNDPHVEVLLYRVIHGKSHYYSKAERLKIDEPGFQVLIRDEEVRFEFKDHYATEKEARKAVKDYIHNWEFDACLKGGNDCFKLEFMKAVRVDRQPTPGVITVDAEPVRAVVSISEAVGTVGHAKYPSPSSAVSFNDPDVQTMYQRYMGYRQGNEPLASMAYFCLTFLEALAGQNKDQRKAAAQKYQIGKSVLSNIAMLSSNKGGHDARKAVGADKDFTNQERAFLEQAIERIIRRAAEKAHNPDNSHPKITLSDLPYIKTDED